MLTPKLDTKLQNPQTVITEKFFSLQSFYDVSSLLEIPEKLLYEILIKNKKQNYTEFIIPKSNGGERIIHSPVKNLAIIQKKLASILNYVYVPHFAAHGFVNNKSIVTNARKHLNKQYVLNFDLEDFFHTINYGRVRGMFKSYFRFNNKVASTLANICCHHDGFLPQGASTSPIISNIIAFPLDRELSRLAYTNGSGYTRYADDITISTNRRRFPINIATRIDYNSPTVLSDETKKIVRKNGFIINEEKTYLRSKYENQTVTGVKVNEKLNVSRSYIRYIRALLYSLEKHFANGNVIIAEEKFMKKYNHRHIKSNTKPTIYAVLQGMISHVGHVRGTMDFLFRELGKRYNHLAEKLDKPTIKIIDDRRIDAMDSYDVFISHASEDKDAFVRPLAECLERIGLSVWYDEFTITWGDRIRDNIDNGLANSKLSIAVISKPYLQKYWAQYEFDGIFQKEQRDNKIYLLPIWHEISKEQIQGHSLTLADRHAISTSDYSIEDIANKVKIILDRSNEVESPHIG